MGQQKRERKKKRIHHRGACHTHIFHMISPTWKGSNPSGSCLQVLLITLEERKAFDRNGFNIGEHMRVKITEGGGLLWYNLLRSRCGVWCAGYVINGVRLAHDITSSMWDLLVFRPLPYVFMYQKRRRKILYVMAVFTTQNIVVLQSHSILNYHRKKWQDGPYGRNTKWSCVRCFQTIHISSIWQPKSEE